MSSTTMYVYVQGRISSVWSVNYLSIIILLYTIDQCQPQSPVFEMRLAGGRTPNEGRLEVSFQDSDHTVWHSVCSDSFSNHIPKLICADLGWPLSYCSSTITPTTELSVDDLGEIRSMSAVCEIDVSVSLSECVSIEFPEASADTCQHEDDVWIHCLADTADIEVRLVDGLYHGDGYVQTRCPNSNWTTVCSSNWDQRDANVVCKQLGLAYGYGVDPEGTLSTDLGDIVVNNVFCTGEEDFFGECMWKNYDSQCSSSRPGVECAEYYEVNGVVVALCGCHHCGHGLAPNPFNNPRQCCKCDCACVAVGDCCPDFDVNVHCGLNDPTDLTINNIPIRYYQCVGVPGSQTNNYGYVLVSKCPETWTDINIRLNCEVDRNLTDIVGLLPVSDSDKVVYKNVFCAYCHNKSIDEVIFWTVEAEAYPGGSGVVDVSLGIFLPNAELIGYAVTWPDATVRPRSCPYDLVDSCAPDEEDPLLISACQSYFAPISFGGYDPRYFRNPHCAICNGISTEDFNEYCKSCDTEMCSVNDPVFPCTPGVCRYNDFLTVEALFDFRDLQSNTFGEANTCDDGTVYDPFLKECRSLSCPPDFILVEETCVPLNPPDPRINETEIIGTNDSIHSLNCLLKSIGFSSPSGVGAIHILTKEVREQITSCIAKDIGCDTTETSTFSLAFLFQSENNLLNFINATEQLSTNYTGNETQTVSTCNVTSISINIYYSDKLALPSECEPFLSNSSEEFDEDNTSKHLLCFAKYDYDQITNNYTTLIAPRSCLVNTNLNCSVTLTLNQSEFEYMATPDESIHLLAPNTTITRYEYLLLSDGTIQICPYIPSPTTTTRSALDIIAAVCQWISVVALLATLITYLVFGSLRNFAGKSVMNLVVALMLAYLGLLLAGVFLYSDAACTSWAILTHLFWLAAFTWMMLFAFNIAKTFSRRGVSTRRAGAGSFWKFMLLGWTIPGVVVGVCLGLHFCQCTSIAIRYGSPEENTCFLRGPHAVLFAFVIPISLLLLLSISLFAFMAIQLRRQRRASKMARKGGKVEEITYEVAIYLRLSTVIGATWVFAFLYILIPESKVVSYIYIILNSLQGVFIFLAFGFTSRVRVMWRVKLTEITSSTRETTGEMGKSQPTKSGSKEMLNSSSKPNNINDTRL